MINITLNINEIDDNHIDDIVKLLLLNNEIK